MAVCSDAALHDIRRMLDDKSPEAREALVRSHTPLVKSIAARYTSSGEPFEDLVQEGYLGLLSAIDLFEPSQGIQFSTYAYYLISGQIRHYLRDRGALIRQPAWIQELRSKVERIASTMTERLGREPTTQEIAAEAGLSEQKVREVQATGRMSRVLRLQPVEGEEDGGFVDPERIAADQGQGELTVEQRMVLEEALQKLKAVEQKVVDAFFFQGQTQAEIARYLQVSHNYVSRVIRNSMRRLQSLLDDGIAGSASTGLSALLHGGRGSAWTGSVTDGETGLYSATYCLERLDEELLRAQRYQYSLAVMALLVWDGHGTPLSQSDVIRQLADLVKSGFRRIDIATRVGQSCFAVLMPHTGETAAVAAERFRKNVAASSQLRERGVTVTSGIAVYPDHGSSAAGLIRTALQAGVNGHRVDPLDLAPVLRD